MKGFRFPGWLVPPLCVVCHGCCDSRLPVCSECVGELNRAPVIRESPPPGVSQVASCAPHEGVARALLASFKFRRAIGLAPLIAGYMADLTGLAVSGRVLVPVPADSFRERWRGFDPAKELALGIAGTEPGFLPAGDLLIRRRSGRQRGRGRQERLSDPPLIGAAGVPPKGLAGREVTLVDDVMTTGATLSACAGALAGLGIGPVSAITFTRRL
jgi:predicted amidophosphoribosyltransferase